MKNKILTIIIPTKNRFFYVKKIILEIKELINLINIIIIDDCSDKKDKEKLENFLKNFKKISFIQFHKNKGQSVVCNHGLKLSKSKYVWFFDDDDFVNKNTLLRIIPFLSKNSPDGILLPMKQIYKKKTIRYVRPKFNEHNYEFLRNAQQKVSTSCAIFKRKNILKIKGWDANLFGGTDTDLFLRFSKNNIFEVFYTRPIIVNFAAPNRVTNNFFRQQKAKISFLYKHWEILTLKRKIYYIISFILCFPLINNLKSKLRVFYNN